MFSRSRILALAFAAAVPVYAAAADTYAKHQTPVVLAMQNTCVDFVIGQVADGSALIRQGFAQKRKTRKRTTYEAKARLPGASFNTVYNVVLFSGKSGTRACKVALIRTSYESARLVYNSAQAALHKRGGRPVAAPNGGGQSLTRFQLGKTMFQVKSHHTSNSLIMEYYIPRN